MTFKDVYPEAADEVEALKKWLLQPFDFDEDRVRRFAVFILAHAEVDHSLIIKLATANAERQKDLNEFEELTLPFEKASSNTFRYHLNEAFRKGLVSEKGKAFATDLNTARDEILHWGPSRAQVPLYRGHDVTTEDGLRVCLEDVVEFLAMQ